jgi:hypothetical protein
MAILAFQPTNLKTINNSKLFIKITASNLAGTVK